MNFRRGPMGPMDSARFRARIRDQREILILEQLVRVQISVGKISCLRTWEKYSAVLGPS
jgi:hypothetical protein